MRTAEGEASVVSLSNLGWKRVPPVPEFYVCLEPMLRWQRTGKDDYRPSRAGHYGGQFSSGRDNTKAK
jgi:hypothetical protein